MPGLTAVVDHPIVRLIARAVVLATYAWAGLAMMAGQDLLTNPIFGFVFVWMWVGLVPISLLLGQFWRATNPLRTIHRGLCALARVDPEQGLLTLPAGIGVWPAAVGLFGFGWLELVQPDRTTLAVLRVWALAWLVILVLGAIVFGQRWIGAADPFEVYASTLAQMSILRRVGDQLRLVNPLAGLNAWHAPPGATAVVAALLGSTAFDSFTNTSWWIQTVQNSDGARDCVGHRRPADDDHHRLRHLQPRSGLDGSLRRSAGQRVSAADGRLAAADRARLRGRPLRDAADRRRPADGDQLLRSARSWLERLRIGRDGCQLRDLQPSDCDRRDTGVCHRRAAMCSASCAHTRRPSRCCHRIARCAVSCRCSW